MTGKQFVCGVANVVAFAPATGNIVFTSRTLLKSSIEVSVSNTDIKAGQGNSLQFIYYHDSMLKGSLEEAQFSLNFIGASIGSLIGTGKNVLTPETVILGAGGTGTIIGTPLKTPDATGTTIYGYVTDKNGITTKITFTGKNFTLAGGNAGDSVCVQYYALFSNASYVTVSANIVPSIVRLVMDVQLFSSDTQSVTNGVVIGRVNIEIPRCQLNGGAKIDMSSSGVSTTPIEFMALTYTDTNSGSCSNTAQYATISQIIDNTNWYDGVVSIASINDPVSLSSANNTFQLDIRAIPINSSSSNFSPPYSDLTFTSSDATKVTVNSSGLLQRVASGSAMVTVACTARPTLQDNIQINIT